MPTQLGMPLHLNNIPYHNTCVWSALMHSPTCARAGVNAGVWLMRGRGCAWCRSFLARWWSLSGFIRTDAASGKSGDNDALKHMIATMDP